MNPVTLEFYPRLVTPETQYALYCALQIVFETDVARPAHELTTLRSYFRDAIAATERLRVRMSSAHAVAMARRFNKDARLRNGYDVRFREQQ